MYRYQISIGLTKDDTHAECWIINKAKLSKEEFSTMVKSAMSQVPERTNNDLRSNQTYLWTLRYILCESWGFSLPPKVLWNFNIDA